MHFADALTQKVSSSSAVCVGLDPHIAQLPRDVSRDPRGILHFGKGIIDALEDTVSCIKVQLAFYELFRWEGMKVFWETCAYAKERGLLVIADGKRSDISSTCEAYADAYLGKDSPIDALTVSPYLGSDSIAPFIECCKKHDKGIFILVKTSNCSSQELQDLPVGDEVVHEYLAQLVESWGTSTYGPTSSLSCVGAVIGATYPEELKYLRTLMPHVPFLIPGYGAQGGTAEDAARGFLPGGMGAIVSASRSIIFASQEKDWQEAARKAAEKMAGELKRVLAKKS